MGIIIIRRRRRKEKGYSRVASNGTGCLSSGNRTFKRGLVKGRKGAVGRIQVDSLQPGIILVTHLFNS